MFKIRICIEVKEREGRREYIIHQGINRDNNGENKYGHWAEFSYSDEKNGNKIK